MLLVQQRKSRLYLYLQTTGIPNCWQERINWEGMPASPGLAEVLNKNPGGLTEFDRMEPDTVRQLILQLFPDTDGEIFNGAEFTTHEGHFFIDITVVKHINHTFLYDGAQFLGIKNKTSFGVGHPFYSDVQFKIVAMPVRIGASPKNSLVLFSRPVGVIKFVSGIEMLLARDVYHSSP